MSGLQQTPDTSTSARSQVIPLVHRVLLSLLGSYAFAWGLTALGTAASVALGVDFHEAETAMLIVSFLVLVSIFIWAFSARNLTLVWLVLGGGAGLMCAAAWGIQQMILG